jgi:hypothetical protein
MLGVYDRRAEIIKTNIIDLVLVKDVRVRQQDYGRQWPMLRVYRYFLFRFYG